LPAIPCYFRPDKRHRTHATSKMQSPADYHSPSSSRHPAVIAPNFSYAPVPERSAPSGHASIDLTGESDEEGERSDPRITLTSPSTTTTKHASAISPFHPTLQRSPHRPIHTNGTAFAQYSSPAHLISPPTLPRQRQPYPSHSSSARTYSYPSSSMPQPPPRPLDLNGNGSGHANGSNGYFNGNPNGPSSSSVIDLTSANLPSPPAEDAKKPLCIGSIMSRGLLLYPSPAMVIGAQPPPGTKDRWETLMYMQAELIKVKLKVGFFFPRSLYLG
jgi:hypothetical protein